VLLRSYISCGRWDRPMAVRSRSLCAMTATKSVLWSGVSGRERERAVRVLTEFLIGELPADAVSKQHYT
jgi:hypothetical protein